MNGGLLLQGFGIGLAISIPVGPVGVLIMRRTLTEGLLSGAVAGFGSAIGMALYGSIAGFGLTAVSGLMLTHQRSLKLVGGVLLLYLGYAIARATPPAKAPVSRDAGSVALLAGSFGSTLFLTVTSPAVLIYFLTLFANVGLIDKERSYAAASTLVGGVFAGAAAWWLTLGIIVSLLRSRLKTPWSLWINRCSGATIAIFGALILLQLWI